MSVTEAVRVYRGKVKEKSGVDFRKTILEHSVNFVLGVLFSFSGFSKDFSLALTSLPIHSGETRLCHGNVERQFKATESRQDHFGRECYGYNITKLNLARGIVKVGCRKLYRWCETRFGTKLCKSRFYLGTNSSRYGSNLQKLVTHIRHILLESDHRPNADN